MSDKSGVGGFWSELRRRRVVRSGGMYVAAAFVALQVGEIVFPAFDLPDWALRSLVVVAVLGLPVVLAIAWVYDLTPGGFERTDDIPSAPASAVPRIAFLAVTSVAMGFAAFAYAQITFGPAQAGAPEGAASFVDLDEDAPITAIAVLPLDSYVEGDPFFAQSLHEEIITQLAEMTSLRVVSRTSVERYASSDQLLPEIARELRVQAIVEGSVTKPADSDSVRITVQLIHAPSDTHLMAQTFEREHRDILRLQREVAQEIAVAIQGEVDMSMSLAASPVASVDPEAHHAFMLAEAEFEKETPEGLQAARDHFRRAIELDSSYSAAYAGLAGTQVLLGLEGLEPLGEVLASAHEEVTKAIALRGVPDAESQAVMVMIQDHMEHLPPEARTRIEVATPDPDSLSRTYLQNFTRLGLRARTAMGGNDPESAERARSRSQVFDAQRMIADADFRSASTLLGQVVEQHPQDASAWDALERSWVLQGRYDRAVEVRKTRLLALEGNTPETRNRIAELDEAFDASDPSTYWQWVRRDHSDARTRGQHASDVSYAAACVALGDHEDAIRNLERALERRDPALLTLRFDPTWDPLRDDPRFREITREVRAALQRGGPAPSPPGR